MRFQLAFDSLEKENIFLKRLMIFGFLLGLLLTLGLVAASTRAPLVIERACHTHLINPVDEAPTETEVRAFLLEAIAQRFNTESQSDNFLSARQIAFREKEQSELKKQKMSQTVVVRSITPEKDSILVDADRLIAIQQIRSAFKFLLRVKVQQVNRSSANPYGLELEEADPIKEIRK